MATTWQGFELQTGTLDGYEYLLAVPDVAAPGRPWIWRTEFFDHEPQLDVDLLRHGWHVATYRISDLYGAPLAVQLMDGFFQYLTRRFRLETQCVLEGFSRGGLYAAEFALAFPGRVAALYLDNPVLDIRSWPGGLGAGPGDANCWEECLRVYGLQQEELSAYTSPVERASILAAHAIPLLAVCGDADEVVPYPENCGRFVETYRARGAPNHLILKPGGLHHPHSLENPAPLLSYLRTVLPQHFVQAGV